MSQNIFRNIRINLNPHPSRNPRWAVLFVAGFLIAMILQLFAGRNTTLEEYLCSENLVSFFYLDMNRNQLLIFLLYRRLIPYLLVLLVSYLTGLKLIPMLFASIIGFSAGTVITGANLLYGWNGILLSFGLFLPQVLFFIPGTLLFLDSCYAIQKKRKEEKRNTNAVYHEQKVLFPLKKMMVAFVVVIIGILTESYVNPLILKIILQLCLW